MRVWRWSLACAWLALSGCVVGYGPCLLQQPFKNNLVGRVHFRSYPASDGIDNVPILAIDHTAYLYAPALSHLCLPTNEVQLVGVAEFPQDVIENTHVSVDGRLFQASTARQHTQFVMSVITILPITPR